MTYSAPHSTPTSDQTAPAGGHYSITPGAGVLAPMPRALYVASIDGGATATIEDINGTSLAYAGLVVGQVLPIKAAKVTAATATLYAWY